MPRFERQQLNKVDTDGFPKITQTGNITGVAVAAPADHIYAAFVFDVLTASGGSQTVEFKIQGSLDGTDWFDILYVTDATDTAASAVRTVTATGSYVNFISNVGSRRYQFYRLVTTNHAATLTFDAWAYFD